MSTILKVAGKTFLGWQSVRIQRGIEQLAGIFELTVTDRWNTDSQQVYFELKPGQECQVLVDDQVLITGYIDSVSRRYDKQSHEISVSGRDKTADLVDCSAVYKTGAWQNKTLDQIAADVLQPFGIGLTVAADVGSPLPVLSIQEGESVYELLERAARMKALLLIADGQGNLVLTRAGTTQAVADCVEGQNILQAEGSFDWKDRFSAYIIKGQQHGSDTQYGEQVAQQQASVQDATINRYRPLIVTAEDQDGVATLAQRAEWERNVRVGRGTRATITVQGWGVDGKLWQPNTLTKLTSPLLGADFPLLIVSTNFTLDNAGTLTELELALPQAFDLIAQTKQTRLEKKMRKAQGDESGITQEEWQFP